MGVITEAAPNIFHLAISPTLLPLAFKHAQVSLISGKGLSSAPHPTPVSVLSILGHVPQPNFSKELSKFTLLNSLHPGPQHTVMWRLTLILHRLALARDTSSSWSLSNLTSWQLVPINHLDPSGWQPLRWPPLLDSGLKLATYF